MVFCHPLIEFVCRVVLCHRWLASDDDNIAALIDHDACHRDASLCHRLDRPRHIAFAKRLPTSTHDTHTHWGSIVVSR